MGKRIALSSLVLLIAVGWVLTVTGCGQQRESALTTGAGVASSSTNVAAPASSTTMAGSTSTSTVATLTTISGATYALTVGTTEGPYYITNTPQLVDGNLNKTGLPGEPITIVGHVYGGTDTSRSIAGAKIEIWQTDRDGVYHPESNGDMSQYSAAEIALRGYVLTDDTGRYQFTTVYPGYYPGRTRHIHIRASADGFGGITTQIIVPAMPGDGTTPDERDRSGSATGQFVTFSDKDGVKAGTFNFFMGPD
jgi:protocatechuate 3,4-dioxygenase beta subunit